MQFQKFKLETKESVDLTVPSSLYSEKQSGIFQRILVWIGVLV